MTTLRVARSPELLELAVQSYKNLESVRIEWSPRLAIYGPNGSGKTNLLEALALACGSRATLWQLCSRAAYPPPGAISLVVRCDRRLLPMGPEACAGLTRAPGEVGQEAQSGLRFWSMMGTDRGMTWDAAVHSGVVDARLAELLVNLGNDPVVRYRLQDLSGFYEARECDRGSWVMGDESSDDDPSEVRFEREFSRCLVLSEHPPDWLVDLAPRLPSPFAPFRRWLAESAFSRSPKADLLELPPTTEVPIRLVWMAAERSTAEAMFDLAEVFELAVPSAFDLLSLLDDALPLRGEGELLPGEGDARWWLVNRCARQVNALLEDICPGFTLTAIDESPQHLVLEQAGRTGAVDRTLAIWDEVPFLERLSSGERVWVDSAFALAAHDLEHLAVVNANRVRVMQFLAEEDALDLAIALEPRVEVTSEGFWNAQDIEVAVADLDRRFAHLGTHIDASLPDEFTTRVAEILVTDVSPLLGEVLTPRLVALVFDEPERHLHPSAQRRVSSALESLPDASIAIATHSHIFLGRPSWQHLHVTSTPEGVITLKFDPAELQVLDPIVHEMGLTRGELLSRIRYVLFVEGYADETVLKTLYGPLLREAGILLLPLSGIDEVKSLAELHIVGRFLDVDAGVLADHVRLARLDTRKNRSDETKEERELRELRQTLKKRGRQLDTFGLKRVDIIAYLDEDIVRERCPGFPGWRRVEEESRRARESFKDAAARLAGEGFGVRLIQAIATEMESRSRPALDDLPHVIATIVSAADRRA